MEIPAQIIPYAFYLLILIFIVFAAVNLYHVFRFGMVGTGAVVVTIIFVGLAALLIGFSIGVLNGYDWSESRVEVPTTLPNPLPSGIPVPLLNTSGGAN